MVERWVKSAVSPDWTVILGWGTFWIPAAEHPRVRRLSRRAAVEKPYRRGKAASPFPDRVLSPAKIFSWQGVRASSLLRTSLNEALAEF